MKILYGENDGSTVTFCLSGELDHHTAKKLRAEIDGEILLSRPAVVKLDFSDVTMMDSSGIGLILGRKQTAQSVGATVRVSGAVGEIGKIIRLSGLERLPGLTITEESEKR
ncbi:MAG: STAS domain-containing protein [Clostridia bacterium]|nr:STAS domain-containing protein [Clostridia bacterium]